MFFDSLNYTLGDEDSSVEYGILKPNEEHIVTIAGSGGRVIPLLARSPKKLTCIDISPLQLTLTRMRIAAIAELDLAEYLGLLGYTSMDVSERTRIFNYLKISSLEGSEKLLPLVCSKTGLIYQGRFEKMLYQLYKLNKLITGRAGKNLFGHETLDEQQFFMDNQFPHKRWNLVVNILGNSAVLNALLYRGKFPKKNLPGSHASIYKFIFNNLFKNIPARSSFFLQMIFLGRLRYSQGYLIECDPKIYSFAKEAIKHTKLDFIHGDIIEYFASCKNVNFVSLSDVPSFFNNEFAQSFLARMKPGLANDATVVTRGHMRIIKPKMSGFSNTIEQYDRLLKAETTQLWKIAAYTPT